MTEPTPYALMGGADAFRRLVHRFYVGVADDPVLRPLYPDEDLGPAEERLRMFLEQYWGGPKTYSEQRGHPRLRMRHAPFRITSVERDAWLHHMREAVDELGPRAEQRRRCCGTTSSMAAQLHGQRPGRAGRGRRRTELRQAGPAEWWRDAVIYQVYVRQLRRRRRRRHR